MPSLSLHRKGTVITRTRLSNVPRGRGSTLNHPISPAGIEVRHCRGAHDRVVLSDRLRCVFRAVEHEVMRVVAGHCVKLKYSLFFDDDGRAFRGAWSKSLSTTSRGAERNVFRAAFEMLLQTPEFFSHGDALGFGLRYVYQVESGFEHVYDLKERLSIGVSMRLG